MVEGREDMARTASSRDEERLATLRVVKAATENMMLAGCLNVRREAQTVNVSTE
jgi:hypothetical protein